MTGRIVPRALAVIVIGGALVLASVAPASAGWGRRDRTPPTTPTNLHVTAVTPTSVSVAWTASTDNVAVASYTAWTTGALVSVHHPQTTATLTGLEPGTAYQVRVRAFDSSSNGSQDAVVDVTTVGDTTPPTVPTGLTIPDNIGGFPVDPVTASTVLLKWTSGTDAFHPVRHEVLVNGVVSPNVFDLRTQGTPYSSTWFVWVRHLDPSTTYEFRVRAVDPSGNHSAPSDPVTATTEAGNGDVTPPTAVTLTKVDSGGSSVCPEELELRWTAATDDVDAPTAIRYEVRINGAITDILPWFSEVVVYTETEGVNSVTIVAVDSNGNASPPSNTLTEKVGFSTECHL